MLDVEFVRQKLKSVLKQIKQLRSSDFPYSESDTVLGLLTDLYQRDLDRLDLLDSSTSLDVRQRVCSHANVSIARFYPFLGFILRSTNVRNAFEIYDPLLKVCRTVYGTTAKLIISSEWNFSPFTYPAVTSDLPDLMLIGSPSTEAGNSLLVPLAGHELGHSVWQKPTPGQKSAFPALISQLQTEITSAFEANWAEFQKVFNVPNHAKSALLTDLFLIQIWNQSYRLGLRQCEELFCDVLGLKIFGEGFAYSFMYLLSPSFGERASNYPSLATRVKAMELGAAVFAIDLPTDMKDLFKEPTKYMSDHESFILRMTDRASDAMIPAIISAVNKHVTDSKLDLPSNDERDRILLHFSALCPPSDIKTMADVINAGWKLRLDWKPWDGFDFPEDVKHDILNDLVFKTMEVLEFETKVGRKIQC